MDAEKQLEQIKRGTVEIITEEDLLAKLKKGKPLNIKLGVDPTSPHVHLGFTVVMRKLRTFQDLGHKITLIVGDYTATVGDPTGKNKTRPMLSHEEVLQNAQTYQEQFFKVVKREGTDIVYNGSWFKDLSFDKVTALMSEVTVAQMLEREDFQNRHQSGQPISLHEFLYPLMQGYDSVMIQADVELGGTDQKFNILRGRELQRSYGQEPQTGLFMPILLGTDGREKMSKSIGNTIGIDEPPQSMFHKLINLPDALMPDYLTLLTDLPAGDIGAMCADVEAGRKNPNDIKHLLAADVVSQYYGEAAAAAAAQAERKIHAGESLPDNIPVVNVPAGEYWVPALMVSAGAAASNGEGRRLVINGGVCFDGGKISDPKANVAVSGSHVLKVGKRNFYKIIAGTD